MADVLFKKVDYSLKKLIEDIDMGDIGLPDIQRPFVWATSKVRDLFDSMYRGFPIGYLLFWENGDPGVHRGIGEKLKQKVPNLLVVDGQQRLTSLYAVMKAVKVIGKDFRRFSIRIAFNPLEEKFEVTNPAIERDAEWISDICELWKPETDMFAFVNKFLQRFQEEHDLSEEKRSKISKAISRLEKLVDYPLTALEVSSSVDEDKVAEIFVRINSKGTPLNQADFILTLMSVFWDEGRAQLEEFCRCSKTPTADNSPSPFNHFLRPNPDQLLRVSVALGFRRARLEYVYSLLRGKDLQTGKFSVEQRESQFVLLDEAQSYTLDLLNWHEFFKVLKRAGYHNEKLISSQLAVLYTYAMWLIGKREFGVDIYRLREVMARWFFMVALKGRYSSSPESQMDQDLAILRGLHSPESFLSALDRIIDAEFTRDFWEVTLPNELQTAAARNTGQFAYYSSLCLLDAQVLYSPMKVVDMLDQSSKGKKSAVERHHLFPRKYLQREGLREDRLINQMANYAMVEWSDNIAISDHPPDDYVPEMEKRFKHDELVQMYKWHALPERWYEMDYHSFLDQRRGKIASVIREGFNKLKSLKE
jgi:hypothetical protein